MYAIVAHGLVYSCLLSVIATYYQNIRINRLAQMLELSEDEAEKHVCDLVVAGSLWCRIDRLKGIATFQVIEKEYAHQTEWDERVYSCLGLGLRCVGMYLYFGRLVRSTYLLDVIMGSVLFRASVA